MKVWVGWARHSQVVNHAQCPMCGAEVGLADDSVVVDEGLEVLNGELGDGGMNSASLLSRRYSSALLDHVLRRLGMTREYAAAGGGSVLFVCTHSVHAEEAGWDLSRNECEWYHMSQMVWGAWRPCRVAG